MAEYFDVGVSRSLPWSRGRRPRVSSRTAPGRSRFDAVVIGEPQRAFSGTQYALTFPVFVHHGVELWVPEVGGRVDPDSEAHDLVMSLFGGLSKAERARIQRRVRNAMQTMARAGGRYLGGRPPYGYRLVPMSAHPNAEKARIGATLNRLEPDPVTAPIVQRIFSERLAGNGYSAIARCSTPKASSRRAADPSPQLAPRRPRMGRLARSERSYQPRYTGHEVSDANDGHELLDPPPRRGHVRRMRWNDPSTWIWSPEPTHEALVTRDDWTASPSRLRHAEPRAAPTTHGATYSARTGAAAQSCGRRMTGATRQRPPLLPLRTPPQPPRQRRSTIRVDVYVREQPLVDALDAWLDELFSPDRAAETARTIVEAAAHDPAHQPTRSTRAPP